MDGESYLAQQNERFKELWNALRTRVLTDEEMAEVMQIGSVIIHGYRTRITWPGYQFEEERIFHDALWLQFKMRSHQDAARELKP